MDIVFWFSNMMLIFGAVAQNYTSPNGNLRLIEVIRVGNVVKGKIEVLLDKRWKPVCASFDWDHNDTTVVCRELGYKGSIPLTVRTPKFPASRVHHKRFDCHGNETFLSMCSHTEISQDCFIEGEAGVVCITPTCSMTKHTTTITSTREELTQSLTIHPVNFTSVTQQNALKVASTCEVNIALGVVAGIFLLVLLLTTTTLIVICLIQLKRNVKTNKLRNPSGDQTYSTAELERDIPVSEVYHNEPTYAVLEDNTSGTATEHTYEDI